MYRSSLCALVRTTLFFILISCLLMQGQAKQSGNKGSETYEQELLEAAVASIADSIPTADIRGIFAYHLRLRGAAVPEADKVKYWQELKSKPELGGPLIFITEKMYYRGYGSLC